jgi:glycosyltransferase involved in cell wall biosynthesis
VRVGLNLLFLVPGEVGGSEIYARELVRALATRAPEHEFIVYCGREAAASLVAEDWPTNVRVSELGLNARNKPARVTFELLRLPRLARKDRLDLLHSLGQTTPLWGCGRRVVTVLDLIFHHFPDTFPGPARRGLELLVPLGAKRSHRVVTISRATKDDLVKTWSIDPDKIDPVLLGAGFTPKDRGLSRPELDKRFGIGGNQFALCVASGHAHKNIARLLEAFTELPEANLVLVGHAGLDQEKLISRARELGLADRVTFTGWIEPEELEGLYKASTMFVYPTLCEGFGLPVLEAMLRGVPVACSNTSSLPEVAGDAALTFDPLDTAAIASAVRELSVNDVLRAELIERGVRRAASFTWQKAAEGTLASYARASAAE